MEKLDAHDLLFLYECLERAYDYHWRFATTFIQKKKLGGGKLREFDNREYITHNNQCDKIRRMQEKLSKMRRQLGLDKE